MRARTSSRETSSSTRPNRIFSWWSTSSSPGWAPFKHLALAGEVPGFIEAHDQILAYDFETFVVGHLTRLGSREDVLDVRENAAEAPQTVDFMAIAQDVGFENQWVLFDRCLDAVPRACTDATLPGSQHRLGGGEVFTFSHRWTMAENLRIDQAGPGSRVSQGRFASVRAQASGE